MPQRYNSSICPGTKPATWHVMRQFVEQAAREGVELILFPECCISGYWHLRKLDRAQLLDLAEPVPEGPSVEQLQGWSREYGMTIGAGLIERDDDARLYNSTVVVMPDGRHACHRKLHAFVSEHLTSGDRYTVFDTPHGWRVAVLICYDNNIIENVRACAWPVPRYCWLRIKPAVAAPAVRLPWGRSTSSCGSGGTRIPRRLKPNSAATRAEVGSCGGCPLAP